MSNEFEGLRRDHASEAKLFSAGRAALHACVVTGVLFLVVLVIGIGHPDPRKFGYDMGGPLLWSFGLTFGASYLVQKRLWGWLVVVGAVVAFFVVSGVAGFTRYVRKHEAARLTSDERRPLEVTTATGERRLRHPYLGFSLRLPDGLEPLPAGSMAQLAKDPRVAVSGWGSSSTGQAVLVFLSTAHTEKDLQSILDGVRDEENAMASKVPGEAIQVVHDELIWNQEHREAHRHITVGRLHVHTDAFVSDYADGRTLSIMIMTIGVGNDAMGELASTFRAHAA